jgi:acyl-CoA dehydrogenase
MYLGAESLALADGPTEVHKVQVAKAFLRAAKPAPGLFPTQHIPTRRAAAKAKHADVLRAYGLAAE